MRKGGILMHISSLPSPYGIGTLGREAYEFADFLQKSGIKLWQILPIGPTSVGDSPYQSFSAFAGNPYFIDIDILINDDLLTKKEANQYDFGNNPSEVDYGKMFQNRFSLLRKAFYRSRSSLKQQIDEFYKNNKYWLSDYAFFMALKKHFNLRPYWEWPDNIKLRTPLAVSAYRELLKDETEFQVFLQFEFFNQYQKLKEYVNRLGIEIIGDIPIYVASDSSDAWAESRVFDLSEEKLPNEVAGVPPDAFSATGQLWGNPLYNWKYLKETGYEWWVLRLKHLSKLFDVVRIDHFRGFNDYWAIPSQEKSAVNGRWREGPKYHFFETVMPKLPDIKIIAEDLGLLNEGVYTLLKQTGFPGMKVLQFAFDESEHSGYLTYNYDKNCIVYTGTHDNDTVAGWFDSASGHDKSFAKFYLNASDDSNIAYAFIKGAWQSTAETAVAPIQDFLNLGSQARINTPATAWNNWKWRIEKSALTDELADKILRLNRCYGRI